MGINTRASDDLGLQLLGRNFKYCNILEAQLEQEFDSNGITLVHWESTGRNKFN